MTTLRTVLVVTLAGVVLGLTVSCLPIAFGYQILLVAVVTCVWLSFVIARHLYRRDLP